MFLSNKYTKWYYQIIEKASRRIILNEYHESHHILPRSLGGLDDADNLVNLTAREHFICHLLLERMCEGENKYKMAYAVWQLSRPSKCKQIIISSRIYNILKKNLSSSMTGRKRKPFSDEWKANMKQSAKTRKKVAMTEERLEFLRSLVESRGDYTKENNPFYGKTHSDESKEKIGASSSARFAGKPKTKSPCAYCGKEVAPNMLNRFHNEQCKFKS